MEIVHKMLGKKCLDLVIYNTEKPSSGISRQYAKKRGYMVEWKKGQVLPDTEFIGRKLIKTEIYKKSSLDTLTRSFLRHDPQRVAKIIKKLS